MHESERVWSAHIVADNSITDRCLRKWVASGRFPVPDGNLNGRNFWLRSTYEQWKADVIAGKYRQQRRPAFPRLIPKPRDFPSVHKHQRPSGCTPGLRNFYTYTYGAPTP